MKYRLICVSDKNNPDKGLNVEICLDAGAKSLSPFQRKINIDDLLISDNFPDDKLCQSIFLTGQVKQPFSFSTEQLCNNTLKEAVDSNSWKYIRNGGKGASLKKVTSFNNFYTSMSPRYIEASLIGPELYITDLSKWWKNIKVRFRYENSSTLFPVQYTNIPFQIDDNTWKIRCSEREKYWITILGKCLDLEYSRMNLKDSNYDFLKDIVRKGCKLYIPKKNDKHTSVYLKSDASGIDWFSTSNIGNNELDDKSINAMLEAFLQNRNFSQVDGNIILFNKKNILDLSADKITKALSDNLGVGKFCEQLIDLSQDEINDINKEIDIKVNAVLKDFQRKGVMWLAKMRKNEMGCMLADDMGLGKTIQVLTHLATLNGGDIRHLVICPSSLTSNWENEINKFTPKLKSKIEIVSYEAVRIHTDYFADIKYDTVIVDEGQFIKNDNTQRYKAIGELECKQMIILSGTPIENSVDEIWAMFKLLIPQTQFVMDKLKKMADNTDMKRWVELSKLFLSPYILRRTKSEVLKNLPQKYESNVLLDLNDEEYKVYDSLRKTFIKAIDTGISGRINSIALEGLLRLRQCCISVNLLPKSLSHKGKMKSTKIEYATKMIKDFIKDGHKVLVFSQFTSAFKELVDRLELDDINPLMLTGTTNNRQSLVDAFQKDDAEKVFLISLKAGGTGLNLTAADRIILLDDWWNPAVENQAFARAHRIGQNKDVMIYRLICKNTVEEKMLQLHKNKREMSDLFNSINDKLSIEQIKNLIN